MSRGPYWSSLYPLPSPPFFPTPLVSSPLYLAPVPVFQQSSPLGHYSPPAAPHDARPPPSLPSSLVVPLHKSSPHDLSHSAIAWGDSPGHGTTGQGHDVKKEEADDYWTWTDVPLVDTATANGATLVDEASTVSMVATRVPKTEPLADGADSMEPHEEQKEFGTEEPRGAEGLLDLLFEDLQETDCLEDDTTTESSPSTSLQPASSRRTRPSPAKTSTKTAKMAKAKSLQTAVAVETRAKRDLLRLRRDFAKREAALKGEVAGLQTRVKELSTMVEMQAQLVRQQAAHIDELKRAPAATVLKSSVWDRLSMPTSPSTRRKSPLTGPRTVHSSPSNPSRLTITRPVLTRGLNRTSTSTSSSSSSSTTAHRTSHFTTFNRRSVKYHSNRSGRSSTNQTRSRRDNNHTSSNFSTRQSRSQLPPRREPIRRPSTPTPSPPRPARPSAPRSFVADDSLLLPPLPLVFDRPQIDPDLDNFRTLQQEAFARHIGDFGAEFM